MEAIIFTGLQGAGKSSFYKEHFFHSHVRISLDLLKTRYREGLFLGACLSSDQRFVIDNTNPSKAERERYIQPTLAARVPYTITGYFFESNVEECLRRNAQRSESERIADVGIYAAAKRLQLPSLEEGFHRLFYVRIDDDQFRVEPWLGADATD